MSENEKRYTVGIVGATGLVGREIATLLWQRDFPYDELVLLATEDSEGEAIDLGDDTLKVHTLAPGWSRTLDIAFLAAPANVARAEAAAAAKAGVVVIDLSDAHRSDPSVPLCVPEVNAQVLDEHRGIVASPSAPATAIAVALHAALGGRAASRVVITAMVPASDAGRKGMEELSAQSVALFNQKEVPLEHFPQRLAFNVIPVVGTLEGDDTSLELGLRDDLRRLLGAPGLDVVATAVRVPLFSGQAAHVVVDTDGDVALSAVRERLLAAPGLELQDTPDDLPMPGNASEVDEVQVGRLRAHGARTFSMWVVSDNLRKGSALNAVQIAEKIVAEELF